MARKKKRAKKNPFILTAQKGKKKMLVGTGRTRKEREKAVRTVLHAKASLKKAPTPYIKRLAKMRLRAVQKKMGEMKKLTAGTIKKAKALKKKGYKITSQTVSDQGAASLLARLKKRRKKAPKKAPKKSGKKSKKVSALKKAMEKAMAKKKSKKKSSKKKASKKKSSSKKKASKKKSPSKKKASKKKRTVTRRRKRKSKAQKIRVNVKGMRKGSKKVSRHRRGKKRYRVATIRKNPAGGIMGIGKQVGDFLVAGDPKEAAYLAAASALAAPLSGIALKVPGVSQVLVMVDQALMKVNPKVANAVSPVLPSLAIAGVLEVVGRQAKVKQAQELAKALMAANIVAIGSAVGAIISGAAGLQGIPELRGVDYTPMAGRHRGMRGVDYTPMAALPSLRGMGYNDQPGSSADFGRGDDVVSPAGVMKSAADFGRDSADFGAIPSMHGVDYTPMQGAHTYDYEEQDEEQGETGDHTG